MRSKFSLRCFLRRTASFISGSSSAAIEEGEPFFILARLIEIKERIDEVQSNASGRPPGVDASRTSRRLAQGVALAVETRYGGNRWYGGIHLDMADANKGGEPTRDTTGRAKAFLGFRQSGEG